MASVASTLLVIITLGFDSFIAGLVAGPMLRTWGGRIAAAAWFGACDGTAALLGGMFPHQFPAPPAAVLYGLGVVVAVQAARSSRWWLAALPILFALDNFAVGAPAVEAPVLAISSAVMAMAGLLLGPLGRRLWQHLAIQRVLHRSAG